MTNSVTKSAGTWVKEPRVALVTTTIRVPEVLRLYRALGPDASIFIVGDRRSPHEAIRAFAKEIDAAYLSDEDQVQRHYHCSEPIGWSVIARRNIGLLEAIWSGADVIVSVDDDNIPCGEAYFDDVRRILGRPFNGLAVDDASGWVDLGRFLTPPVRHRGFPYGQRRPVFEPIIRPVVGRRVGVAAGLWLGDPDVDAIERLANGPLMFDLPEIMRAGFVLAKGARSPFNSQNTAFVRAVAPMMMVLPPLDRYDDIWGSYVAQRVLEEQDYAVHFGRPFVWQQRNQHDLLSDLESELLGARYTDRFVADLAAASTRGSDPASQLRSLFEAMRGWEYVPRQTVEFGLAWCADLERVLR
jgi:Reversibly glycosylated polypeptide